MNQFCHHDRLLTDECPDCRSEWIARASNVEAGMREALVVKPHPGSAQAIADGCKCPVVENNYGCFPPAFPTPDLPEGGWMIISNCPVHVRDMAFWAEVEIDE